MSDPRYDFDAFAMSIAGKRWHEMLEEAHGALARAESGTSQVKGAVKKRAAIGSFPPEMKALLFFLQSGTIPHGQYGHPLLYKEIAEHLVKIGDWKPTALDVFKGDAWKK